PVLTDEATAYISNAWTQLRTKAEEEDNNFRAVPITVRTLETLIRLSTAHAKLRLTKAISKKDCEVAFEMLNFALYHETGKDYLEVSEDYDEEAQDIKKSATKKKSAAKSISSGRKTASKGM